MSDETQSPPSDNDIIARLMALEPEETQEPEEQPESPEPTEEQDTEPVDSEEPAETEAEEEPKGEPEESEDFLELQYNGALEKVNRERAQTLAQQGLFYERNQAQAEQHWTQAKEVAQQVVQQLQAAPELREAEAAVALYERALNSIDLGEMQQLATEDPAKYLSKLAEYNTLNRRAQEAKAKLGEVSQKVQESMNKYQAETLQRERDALLKAVPDWRDGKKFDQAKSRILAYMAERGFSQQELSSLMDHRALLVAYDAARFRESQKALKASAKQLGQKPKVAKPGASVGKAEANDEATKALRQQLKKTGRLEDAAKLFERFG